ncbi:MAG: RibD family protein [Fidelibacterota bacterium]|nr:MAG: RibD family protein [Candidatus Neomarinimicrobiota bacterium]
MLPRIVVHNAVSVDGRIDWFTPDVGQFYGLAARWKEDATLAGSDTIYNAEESAAEEEDDIPEPPVVEADDARPLLVVPDSRGGVHNWRQLRESGYWRDMVALCAKKTPQTYRDYLDARYIHCIIAGEERVDLREALEELHARVGVELVRVDSGGTLNGVLFRAGLVDEVSLLIHPSLVGGTSSRSMYRAPDLTTDEGVIDLKLIHCEQLENGVVWVRYEVIKEA